MTKIVKTSQIAKLREALTEVVKNRQVFSPEAHASIVRALLDKIRILQTLPNNTASAAPAAPSPDEIRLVSVMFVDIIDSTLMAQKLKEPDVWKRLIGRAHQRLASAVEEWDGEIGQYLGDGLLCFFGAHRSRGDDAMRAVACSLALQQKMQAYAAEVKAEFDIDFAVRIALSTGKVVVGMIGTEEKQEFLAMGQTTNLAARLQALCPPGKVLIDAQTYLRVRNHFVTEARAPIKLKGFEELVEYYEVLERRPPTAVRFASHEIAGIPIPLVGREVEIASLKQIWQETRANERCYVVTLHGDTGTGKSRLLEETVEAITQQGTALTLMNMVAQYERRDTPYGLLRSMLAGACQLADDTAAEIAEQRISQYITQSWHHPDAEAAAAVIGYLTGFGFVNSPHVTMLKRGGPEHEHTALAWLGKWFEGLADNSPLLLVIDNVQWADAASLELLQDLAQRLATKPLLIMAAARLEFRTQNLLYMHRVKRHTEMTLSALTEDDAVKLINIMLQTVDKVPPALVQIVSSRSEGNPLFIEEFLRMLFDNGVFEPLENGRWKVNRYLYSLTISTLPNGLMGVLQARLDDLLIDARHVVQAAAIIGQTFWSGTVSWLLERDVKAVLADLAARGILTHHSESSFENEDEYSFRHTLYSEVAYEMLTRSAREGYHHKAAQWFASRVPDRPEYLPVLADHYVKGQQYEQAIYVYHEAVQDRLQRGMMAEALKLVETALALSRNMPRAVALPVVVRLWLAQGIALYTLTRYDESSAASRTAMMLLEETPGDTMVDERATAARMLGVAYRSMGRYDEAMEALSQAHNLLLESGSDKPVELAAVLRAFGNLTWYRGYLSESEAYLQRALLVGEQAQDRHSIAGALTLLGHVALDRGQPAPALRNYQRVFELNRQGKNRYYQVLDLSHIGHVYLSVFAYERALETFDQAEALRQQIHFYDPRLQVQRAHCWIALGKVEDGLNLLQEAAGREIADVHVRQQVGLALIHGLALTGQYALCRDRALQFVTEAYQHNPLLYGRGLLWLGLAQHALGEPHALQSLQQALQNEDAFGGRDTWLCYYALGTASATSEEAAQHYAKAAAILRARAASLNEHPELQVTLLNNSFVQAVMASGQE
ncbi:MAG: AAA family ATPase [Chloroflexi bacterium]|nr:AAA family ATPase [Chloroflexota bacterium]